jgi:hypothetical protein
VDRPDGDNDGGLLEREHLLRLADLPARQASVGTVLTLVLLVNHTRTTECVERPSGYSPPREGYWGDEVSRVIETREGG